MPFLENHMLLQVSCGLLKTPHCTGLKFLKLTERGLRSKEIILDLLLESYTLMYDALAERKIGPF